MSQLITKIRTVEERDRLNEEVDLLLSSIYQGNPGDTNPGLDRALKTNVRLWVADLLRENIPVGDIKKTEGYLNGIKSDLEKLRIFEITLAFEPTDVSVDKFIAYVREVAGQNVILKFNFDRNILGGAQINWNGEYRDFSLKRLFEDEYKLKEKEIIKIMYTK